MFVTICEKPLQRINCLYNWKIHIYYVNTHTYSIFLIPIKVSALISLPPVLKCQLSNMSASMWYYFSLHFGGQIILFGITCKHFQYLRNYINTKPLGSETLLDKIALDFTYTLKFGLVVFQIISLLHHFPW